MTVIKETQRHKDRVLRVVCNKCDICHERLMCSDDIESQIDMLDDVNNSYESEHDKQEHRLLLCDYCKREYLNPGYEIL